MRLVNKGKEQSYLPVEEILSHSKKLIQAITVGNVELDDTYKDIIAMVGVALDSGLSAFESQMHRNCGSEILH